MESPIIVGLDIGTTKIAVIAGRKNEYGKLEILGFGRSESNGVQHGKVLNIDHTIKAIHEALKNCAASNPDLEIGEVYVGIAGHHIKSIQTRGDLVRQDPDTEIKRSEREILISDQKKGFIPPGDEIIEVIPQDYKVDNIANIKDPIGYIGVKVGANFHIITADRNAIKNIIRCVDKSGLKARDLVLQPLASAAAVINDEDLEAGVAIVDIGGGTTDMAVFYDGILKHTSVIPYGGVNITEDIKMGLGVLRAHAEQLKVNYGTAIAGEANPNAYITIPGLRGLPPREVSMVNLAHIIEARMVEILDHVLHQLKQIGLEKRLYGGIILTGGGSQLRNIRQLAEFATGLSTRIGYPNEHLAGGENSEKLMNPAYATCIGLILRGYQDYESATPRFVGDQANSERSLGAEAVVEAVAPVPEPEEPVTNDRPQRKGPLGNLVNVFKNQFMELFGEMEEQNLDNIKNQ